MPVAWRDQLSTGNLLIDQDHKYLICLFNSIELALTTPDNMRHLPLFFDQLFAYTQEHFAREEKLQLKIEYPRYADHKYEHQQILARLEEVNNELRTLLGAPEEGTDEGTDDGGSGAARHTRASLEKALGKDILGLAREWVIDHVAKADQDLARYLRQYDPEFR